MAEDTDDAQKTEEPTDKKLSDAFKKGDVAKSTELKTWFVLLAITLAILMSSKGVATDIRLLLESSIGNSYALPTGGPELTYYLQNIVKTVGGILMLPMILLVIGAFAGTLAQHKPMITTEKIKPKLNKISPLAGIKRMFSMQNFMELIKSIAKLIIVGGLVVFIVWPERNRLETMMTLDVSAILDLVYILTLKILGAVVGIMAFVAAFDFMFQKAQFMKKMKMSKQEIKDEMKQSDGDPHVKGRLRQLRMERSRNRMMAAVPEADVIVTNPTHYAVALTYAHGDMQVPKVVAKGMDNMAMKIRELAKEHNIPILENPPLARTLYATVEVDDEIAPEQYQAVAEVISFVLKLKRGERVIYKAPPED
jgi:flagellar biosynthetic protein FlhB